MVDPLTVFAAAGNALQFAEFAIKVVKKTIEYSTEGGSSEHQELQDVVQRLLATSAGLQNSIGQSSQLLPPGPIRALYTANKECMKVSKEAFDLLEELKLNRYGTFWRSSKSSVKYSDDVCGN